MNEDMWSKLSDDKKVELRKQLSKMWQVPEEDVTRTFYNHKILDEQFFNTLIRTISAVTVMVKDKFQNAKTDKEQNEIIFNIMSAVTILMSPISKDFRKMLLIFLAENNENIENIINVYKKNNFP